MMMTKRAQRALSWRGRMAVVCLATLTLPVAGSLAQEVVAQDPQPIESPVMDALKAPRRVVFECPSGKVTRFADVLAKLGGLNIVVSPDAGARTVKAIRLTNVSYAEALDMVCAQAKLTWRLHKPGIIRLDVERDFVHVLGAVGKPGQRELGEGCTTVSEFLSKSQPSEDADLTRVSLIRPDHANPMTIVIDFKQMALMGDTTHNFVLRHGDIVHVPGGKQRRSIESIQEALLSLTRGRPAKSVKSTKPLVDKLRVEKGDIVSCVVPAALGKRPGAENLSMLSLPQRIGADGTIFVPYLGNLKVLGLSRKEAEAQLIKRLEAYFTFEMGLTLRVSSDR